MEAYVELLLAANERLNLTRLTHPDEVARGHLLAWKGPLSPADEELQRGATAAALLGGARPQLIQAGPPQLGGHSFVRLTKQGTTPSRYPRRPGEPARRPLG